MTFTTLQQININHQSLFLNYSKQLIKHLSKYIQYIFIKADNSCTQIYIKNFHYLKFIIIFLKKSTLYRTTNFIDITARHYLLPQEYFLVDYIFSSIAYNTYLRLTLKVKNTVMSIESISSLFLAAVWAEREIFDMFGIFFFNNFDLRKILTDYGFKGNPLKKNFPLVGYYEIFYSESTKQLKVAELSNSQLLNKKYIY